MIHAVIKVNHAGDWINWQVPNYNKHIKEQTVSAILYWHVILLTEMYWQR